MVISGGLFLGIWQEIIREWIPQEDKRPTGNWKKKLLEVQRFYKEPW